MSNSLVEIKYPDNKLKQLEKMFAQTARAVPRVIMRGINRTVTPARTQISRELRKEINIKAGDLNEKINVRRATMSRWEARIELSTYRIPLLDFGARQTAEGVTYKIKKSGARELIPSAFIATMSSGHRGVFKRLYKQRLPIQEKFGPSIGIVFQRSEQLVKTVTADAMTNLEKNIDAQVKYLLSQRAA
jgi:DNA-binding transcriptional regulator YiaG